MEKRCDECASLPGECTSTCLEKKKTEAWKGLDWRELLIEELAKDGISVSP